MNEKFLTAQLFQEIFKFAPRDRREKMSSGIDLKGAQAACDHASDSANDVNAVAQTRGENPPPTLRTPPPPEPQQKRAQPKKPRGRSGA